MKVSDRCIELIKQHEGVRTKAYLCPANKPTVGVGHLILEEDDIEVGQRISMDRVAELLRQDLKKAEMIVNKLNNVELLDQCMFDALVSFVFNVGGGNFTSSTLRKKVEKHCRDFEPIGMEFAKWCYAGGKISNGLISRRRDEYELYCSETFNT